MKTLLIGLILSFSAVADDHYMPLCDDYVAQVVACYEKGHIQRSYDETGLDCGVNGESVWLVEPSQNSTIQISIYSTRSYGYMGGVATDSTCYVRFQSASKEKCSFELETSLGSDDGSMTIRDFSCKK